jgi:outer membrane protein assembly factor BamE (lipoprotein component of BamABCDE complex)
MKLFSIIFVVFLSGCVAVQSGKEIDQSAVQSFVDGETTINHVVSALGNPQISSTSTGGLTVYTYYRSSSKVHGLIGMGGVYKTEMTTVSFIFDAQGKMVSRHIRNSKYGTN